MDGWIRVAGTAAAAQPAGCVGGIPGRRRRYRADPEGGLRGAVNGVMLERTAAVVALVALVAATQPFFLPRVGEDTAGWIGSAVALSVAATAPWCCRSRLAFSMRWSACRAGSSGC